MTATIEITGGNMVNGNADLNVTLHLTGPDAEKWYHAKNLSIETIALESGEISATPRGLLIYPRAKNEAEAEAIYNLEAAAHLADATNQEATQ